MSAVTAESAVVSAQIAGELRAEILRGEFAPGDRIRQEVLAQRFGTSRLPVREALRILELDGLVVTQANRGARIPALTLAECSELYRVRELLEPLLLGASAEALPGESLAQMVDLQARMETPEGLEPEQYLELDRQFHLISYEGAQLPYVRSQVEQLLNRTQHYRRSHSRLVEKNPGMVEQRHLDHRLILAALRVHDGEQASEIMRLHTRRSRRDLLNHPEMFHTA